MSLGVGTDVRLNNGERVPLYGLGLSHNGGGFSSEAVEASLACGVRLYDTAKRYGTEQPLGQAIARAQVQWAPFVTTKLWPGDVGQGSWEDIENEVVAACRGSLQRLGCHKLDLFLVHWPGLWGANHMDPVHFRRAVWSAMCSLVDLGLCRSVGVSNFQDRHLDDILVDCAAVPQVNQIELNPLQFPRSLVDKLTSLGIAVGGYCPLAKGQALSHAAIARIGAKHHQPPASVCLRWSLQHGFITIPKTTSPARVRANLGVFGGWELDEDDMRVLDGLHCDLRSSWDPTGVL